jgi:hypothetical protein
LKGGEPFYLTQINGEMIMSDTLYDITRELVILNNYDESEITEPQAGEDRLDLLKQTLDNLNMQFLDKVTNIVKFIKNLESNRDAVSAEAKRFERTETLV